jgi:hypothetical protein
MKNTRFIFLSFLLASLTLASNMTAQTTEDQRSETENDTRSIDSIAAARSQYTQPSDTSPDASDTTIAQLRRGGPGRPLPPRAYPRGTYQTQWMDHGNAGHIFVGAAIGFGIGAAIGASGSARNGTPVAGGIIIGGGLFALLGGCVGKAVGDLQGLHYASARRRGIHRPSGPEDDEESERRRHTTSKDDQREASAKPASPSQIAGIDSMVQASTMPVP